MDLDEIKEMFPEVSIEIRYSHTSYCEKDYGIIVLDRIAVPKENRKKGIGTDIMSRLCKYADTVGSILMLTPSTSLGATSVSRLKKFYSRFGLKSNSGKRKIFQFPNYGMYRFPNQG